MATIQIDASAGSPLRDGAVDVESGRKKKSTKKANRRKSRSCVSWWSILPHTYKFFIILIALCVLLVSFLYLQKLIKHIHEDLIADKSNATRRLLPNPDAPLPPSASTLHLFKNGAVCSDSVICSDIGSKMFEKNGNVVDAALATLFCNGLITMQSMGIGGGFVMNLFINGKAYSLNSREVAPIHATADKFKRPEDIQKGPLVIATPGEMKGYWEVHKRFGSLKWKDLIEPSIRVCEDGFKLTQHMADSIQPELVNDAHLRKFLFNNETNEPYKVGEHIYPPQQLCNTYKILAENGGDDFYTGDLADLIIEDLQDIGSVITKKDLLEYKTRWSESIPVKVDENTVYVTPAPTGGTFVAFILNVLKGYNFSPESIATEENKILTYHRIVEAFKYAFGLRTQMGDPDFANMTELVNNLTSLDYAEQVRENINDTTTYNNPLHYGAKYDVSDDKGTSHISVLAPNGDAIAVTTSVNFYFGCGLTGKRTGILFNTGMNDFGVPSIKNHFGLSASPNNYIQPFKRSLSSMSPIIITDKNSNVKLVIGASGGTKIITGIASAIIRTLWFEQNIKEVVDAARIHHQLEPMTIEYEYGNTQTVIDGLKKLGHEANRYDERGSIICAIAKNETGIYANADFRKAGDVVGL